MNAVCATVFMYIICKTVSPADSKLSTCYFAFFCCLPNVQLASTTATLKRLITHTLNVEIFLFLFNNIKQIITAFNFIFIILTYTLERSLVIQFILLKLGKEVSKLNSKKVKGEACSKYCSIQYCINR